MSKSKADSTVPPAHLSASTREWYASICRDYDLESQDLKILRFASEAWDRANAARLEIKKHGMVFEDRFGQPHARPEIKIELDNRKSFTSLMRELALDVAPPAEPKRPPPLRANTRE